MWPLSSGLGVPQGVATHITSLSTKNSWGLAAPHCCWTSEGIRKPYLLTRLIRDSLRWMIHEQARMLFCSSWRPSRTSEASATGEKSRFHPCYLVLDRPVVIPNFTINSPHHSLYSQSPLLEGQRRVRTHRTWYLHCNAIQYIPKSSIQQGTFSFQVTFFRPQF